MRQFLVGILGATMCVLGYITMMFGQPAHGADAQIVGLAMFAAGALAILASLKIVPDRHRTVPDTDDEGHPRGGLHPVPETLPVLRRMPRPRRAS